MMARQPAAERVLEHLIAKKKDGLLACYQIIAEQTPKLNAMEAELRDLRTVRLRTKEAK